MGYLETFSNEKPNVGLDIVRSRFKRAKAMNDEWADLIKERILIEETYSKQLAKLSKKAFVLDRQSIGTIQFQCERLQSEMQELSKHHSKLASELASKVEKPLRTSPDLALEPAEFKVIESNALKVCREYTEMNNKIQKRQKSSEKTRFWKNDSEKKKKEMNKSVDELSVAFESEMKKFYEASEQVDQIRVEALKTILFQYADLQSQLYCSTLQTVEDSKINYDINVDECLKEFCSNYTMLNISSSSLGQGVTKQSSKDNGFGSWILKNRKNSSSTIGSSISRGENTSSSSLPREITQPPLEIPQAISEIPVDEEGYSVPPPHSTQSPNNDTNENADQVNSDEEGSDASSTEVQQPKVQFEIKEKAITENPEDVALAFSKVTSTLKLQQGPGYRSTRARRDRTRDSSIPAFTNGSRPHSTFSEPSEGKNGFSPISGPAALRPISAYTLRTYPGSPEVRKSIQEQSLITSRIEETINALIVDGKVQNLIVSGKVYISVDPKTSQEQLSDLSIHIQPNPLQPKIYTSKFLELSPKNSSEYSFVDKNDIKLIGKDTCILQYAINATDNFESIIPMEIYSVFNSFTDSNNTQFSVSIIFNSNEKKSQYLWDRFIVSAPITGCENKSERPRIYSVPMATWNSSDQTARWSVSTTHPNFTILGQAPVSSPFPVAIDFSLRTDTSCIGFDISAVNKQNQPAATEVFQRGPVQMTSGLILAVPEGFDINSISKSKDIESSDSEVYHTPITMNGSLSEHEANPNNTDLQNQDKEIENTENAIKAETPPEPVTEPTIETETKNNFIEES